MTELLRKTHDENQQQLWEFLLHFEKWDDFRGYDFRAWSTHENRTLEIRTHEIRTHENRPTFCSILTKTATEPANKST